MKYTFLSFLLLFLLQNNIAGQSIKTGAPYQSIKDNFRAYIPNGEEVMAIHSTTKVTSFHKINTETLSSTLIKEVKLPKNIFNFERLIKLGGKHYIFYSFIDSKTSVNLYVGEVDLEQGGFVEPLKKLTISEGGRQSHPKPYTKNPHGTDTGYGLAFSAWDFRIFEDNDKLLITTYNFTDSLVELSLLDQDLDKLWTKKIKELPSKLDKKNVTITVSDYNIDSEDNIYISTYATSQKWLEYEQKAELCKVSASGKTSLIDLNINAHSIREVWIRRGNKGQLKCIIAYSVTPEKQLREGFAFGDIENGQVVNIHSKNIKPILYEGKNWVGSTAIASASFSCNLDKTIKHEDGSLVYLFQFEYMRLETDALSTQDNIIIKVNADQSIAWAKVLPKNQRSGFLAGEVGYKYVKKGAYHYIIFLDSENSSKKYAPDIPANDFLPNQKGVLSYYKIDHSSGDVSKHQFFDIKEKNISNIHINKITSTGSDKLIIEAKKSKKEEVLISIDLK